MEKTVGKSTRICAMCSNWNGCIGPRKIDVKPGGFYSIDYNEENKCYECGMNKKAWNVCGKFSPRY